jgi:hypothetical protein
VKNEEHSLVPIVRTGTCTVEEQQAIIESINDEIPAARKLRQVLAERLAGAERVPAAMLREAFGGKI